MDAFPTLEDLRDVLGQAMRDPLDFLTRGTVVTGALVLVVIYLTLFRRRSELLHRAAPTFAVILVYLAIGALALGIENLVRFHDIAPHSSEVQFVSGFTHSVITVAGIALLFQHLRRRTRSEWLRAHVLAVAYWTVFIVVFTPEWFEFQGQREVTRVVALLGLAISAAVTGAMYIRPVARRSPAPALRLLGEHLPRDAERLDTDGHAGIHGGLDQRLPDLLMRASVAKRAAQMDLELMRATERGEHRQVDQAALLPRQHAS